MYDIAPRTALIVGADSHTGRELARLFAQDGHDLVLIDRSGVDLRLLSETLRARHQVRVSAINADLSDAQAPHHIHDTCQRQNLRVSYLVNDAGQCMTGTFVQTDLLQELALVQLQVSNMLALAKLFLRDMLLRNEGRILLLAAGSPAQDTPSAVCHAGNAFILDFAHSIDGELRDSNVSVDALLPADVEEDAPSSALQQEHRIARAAYRALMLGHGTTNWPARTPQRQAGASGAQAAWSGLGHAVS